MLTYSLSAESGLPLYEQLYLCIRNDIRSGVLAPGTHLPSKRSFAGNLGVSSITVEGAYNRLIDEGYVLSEPKRGYYVSEFFASEHIVRKPASSAVLLPPASEAPLLDLSGSRSPSGSFPFSVWARLMRRTINDQEQELLTPSPCGGIRSLREAIAAHLSAFRGMQVDPDQIVVGAGTEYLYGLLIRLLGTDRVYCLEDPGYPRIAQIYLSNGVSCRWAAMDDSGMSLSALETVGADIAHISPTHHFPTGITMPVARRYELLAWAAAGEGRFVIEDDYDSEFRLTGRPIPSLQSIDRAGSVIYMNTFSKTLASTVRISYMVLPPALANEYYRRLSFYSCTVSNFEQLTLARFLAGGYFEKHLNRMRLSYGRLRRELLKEIAVCPVADRLSVLERDSGLHFLLQIRTRLSDAALADALRIQGVKLLPLSVYYHLASDAPPHTFIINYSALTVAELKQALDILAELLRKENEA